jgi:ribose/xylose/arabinose/galactoside ABC-type transport system permease subunit
MYIVGGNAEAARMMGVSVTGTMTTAHAICSVMAAFGGIFLATRVGAAYPLSGTGYELYAIAAVVIGGARLTGGVRNVSGTVAGTLKLSQLDLRQPSNARLYCLMSASVQKVLSDNSQRHTLSVCELSGRTFCSILA